MECDTRMLQNLRDAGCSEAFIQTYRMQNANRGYAMLRGHREELLDELHKAQFRLDSLDYLLYSLKST